MKANCNREILCCSSTCPNIHLYLSITSVMQVGSADHHIHCYDLRNVSQPVHVFGGHQKAVSYVKFLSTTELASASSHQRTAH